jgi:hypothetical protein
MQFTLSTVVLAFAGLAVAIPAQQDSPRFPVPDDLTVEQAQAKCGNKAQLSCCNTATYAGDTTNINSGTLSGVLSNLIGAGSGAKGVGIFDQCSKLDAQGKFSQPVFWPYPSLTWPQSLSFLISLPRTSSTRSASRTSPAAPTHPPRPATTSSALVFLALPLALFSKRIVSESVSFVRWKNYRSSVVCFVPALVISFAV